MGGEDLKSIKEVLEKITSRQGWEKGGTILRWQDLWKRCVGPYVAKKTEVTGVRGRKAVIAVAHSVLASELTLQKATILAKLREKGGKKAPEDLIFKVDPELEREKEEESFTPLSRLDPETRKEIERLTEHVKDPDLRKRFARILAHSFQREEKK